MNATTSELDISGSITDYPSGPANNELVVYDQGFATQQILDNIRPLPTSTGQTDGLETGGGALMEDGALTEEGSLILDMEIDEEYDQMESTDAAVLSPPATTPVSARKKRKARAKTPVVDDEMRRSSRFRKNVQQTFYQLDREPRRKPGAEKKTVYFSTVEDLKSAIICKSLEADLEVEDVEPIQADTLLLLGTSFCGIPPEELADADLQHTPEE